MSNPNAAQVNRLVGKLERWVLKRERRGLDSDELRQAIKFLRQFSFVLAASEVAGRYNGKAD